MIAKGVVFVQDEDGNNYYIPKDKLDEWNYYVDLEYFVKNGVMCLSMLHWLKARSLSMIYWRDYNVRIREYATRFVTRTTTSHT